MLAGECNDILQAENLFEGSTAGGEVKPGKFTIYSNVLDEGAIRILTKEIYGPTP